MQISDFKFSFVALLESVCDKPYHSRNTLQHSQKGNGVVRQQLGMVEQANLTDEVMTEPPPVNTLSNDNLYRSYIRPVFWSELHWKQFASTSFTNALKQDYNAFLTKL